MSLTPQTTALRRARAHVKDLVANGIKDTVQDYEEKANRSEVSSVSVTEPGDSRQIVHVHESQKYGVSMIGRFSVSHSHESMRPDEVILWGNDAVSRLTSEWRFQESGESINLDEMMEGNVVRLKEAADTISNNVSYWNDVTSQDDHGRYWIHWFATEFVDLKVTPLDFPPDLMKVQFVLDIPRDYLLGLAVGIALGQDGTPDDATPLFDDSIHWSSSDLVNLPLDSDSDSPSEDVTNGQSNGVSNGYDSPHGINGDSMID